MCVSCTKYASVHADASIYRVIQNQVLYLRAVYLCLSVLVSAFILFTLLIKPFIYGCGPIPFQLNNVPMNLVKGVMLLNCVRKVLASNHSRTLVNLSQVFSHSSQSLQANAGIEP